MATILRGYGWESGQAMVNTIDRYPDDANVAADTDLAKTGTYSLRIRSGTPATGWARFAITGSPSNPSISVWVNPQDVNWSNNGTGARNMNIRLLLTTGEYIELRWDATAKTFDAYVNNVKVADGSVTVAVLTWFHVQFSVVIADAGTIDVKINGQTSITYAGDTQPGIAASASYVYLTGEGGGGATGYAWYDDLVIGYGGFLGDLRCPDIRPNADTAVDDWTPSAGGDNYAMVDEVSTTPATIDADYNKAGLDGDADELALGDFDGATYVPVAVTAWCRAQQLAANGDSIKIGIDSNGTEAMTEWPLSNTMEYYFHTSDQNPDDSAEWEDADIDALLVRYEAVIV